MRNSTVCHIPKLTFKQTLTVQNGERKLTLTLETPLRHIQGYVELSTCFGKTIYLVTACGKATYISHLDVLSLPAVKRNGGYTYEYVKVRDIKYGYVHEPSLHDMHILPNDYNRHASFHTLEEAQAYADYVKAHPDRNLHCERY